MVRQKLRTHRKKDLLFILFAVASLIFSLRIMVSTFSYDPHNHAIVIAGRLWSDFGAHIPLIRSFSVGNNWPPQSPLFPGLPIKYHFGFYAFVGFLERLGVRIDWALNIPSIAGMFGMLVLTYLVAYALYRSRVVALLSGVFVVFNGSLSFLRYFETNGMSLESIRAIPAINQFPSFGPWDKGLVTAFWNLNIYTNQRHLAPAFAIVLGVFYLLMTNKKTQSVRVQVLRGILIGIGMSILLYINQAALLIAALFVLWIFVITPEARISSLVAGALAVPPFLFLLSITDPAGTIVKDPGYLATRPLTAMSCITFWWHNLGLHMVFIPLGLLLSPKHVKKLLIIPLLVLFVVPNVVRFSPDMINNHKFFNFFLIIGGMASAYTLRWIWNASEGYVRTVLRFYVLAFFFLLTFSGIIDYFVVFNDTTLHLGDIGGDADVDFFFNNTDPKDVILNSTWLYHPANIAGRPVYAGFSYFTWSYGYDKDTRETVQNAIYGARTKDDACRLLERHAIRYVELNDSPEAYIHPHWEVWKDQLQPVYRNEDSKRSVYDARVSCGKP